MTIRMLTLLAATFIAIAMASFSFRVVQARDVLPYDDTPPTHQLQAQEIDDNDDTRVEVQLVVFGVAAGVVVVIGSAAYLLRKRLGLVAGPPEQPADSHH